MEIHSIFILQTSGNCVYYRNFTNEFKFEINLLTPFFSAIITFSERIVSKKLEVLEMSGLRFVFQISNEFIFVILCDESTSLLFVTTRIKKIIDEFFLMFDASDIVDYQQIESPELDVLIDNIITGKEERDRSRVFYAKVIEYFKKLIFSDEILGAAMLTIQGNIIYSSLPDEILIRSLKELEIRFSTGMKVLPEFFYGLETGEKVFSRTVKVSWKLESFFVVLLFDKTIPLGMAELNLEKIAKIVQNIM